MILFLFTIDDISKDSTCDNIKLVWKVRNISDDPPIK